MRTLVTGAAGYIGSHTCVELLSRSHQLMLVDNLANSSAKVLDRIEKISGSRPSFVRADVRDTVAMTGILADF